MSLLPLLAWGYRDSLQAYSTLEVSLASAATPAAKTIVVQRGPGSEWAKVCERIACDTWSKSCQADLQECARVSIPSACNVSVGSCRAVLPTVRRLSISDFTRAKKDVSRWAIPAICARAAVLCEEVLPIVAAFSNDSAQTLREHVAQYVLPAVCRAARCHEVFPFLLSLSDDPHKKTKRKIAEYALPAACAAGLCEQALPTLRNMSNDEDDRVRQLVVQHALPAACWAARCHEVFPFLLGLVRDRNVVVRSNVAAFALPAACKAGLGEQALPVLRDMIKDRGKANLKIRVAVASGGLPAAFFAYVGCNATLPLLHALEDDDWDVVRSEVARHSLPAACRVGCCKKIVESIMRLSEDNATEVRKNMVWYSLPIAFRANPSKDLVPIIHSLAMDSHRSVKVRLASHVLPVACRVGLCPPLLPEIRRLTTGDHMVVEPIAKSVVPTACEADTDLCQRLLVSVVDMGRHESEGVRLAVADSASTICGSKFCEELLPLLVNLSHDVSPYVGGSARRSLSKCIYQSRLGAEAAIIENLSIQVLQLMAFDESGALEVPHGVAISLVGRRATQFAAHRCPNRAACPGAVGVRLAFSQPTCGSSAVPSGPCADGYEPDVPGCAGCKEGYGRLPTDPFKCKKCGSQVVNILSFLAPLGIFLLGMKSALNPQSERFGSLLKITISYGTSFSLILNALPIHDDLIGMTRGAFNLPLAAADDASGFVAGSIDCLVEHPADVTTWFLGSTAVPVALLVITVAVVTAWSYIYAPDRSLVTLVLRPILVFTNSFLPVMLISFLRSWPCYHTQANDVHEAMMMYDVTRLCPGNASWQSFMSLSGLTFTLAFGPGLWCVLFLMAEKWDDTVFTERLGFLTGAYKADKRWWEATVLVRKLCFAAIVALCPQSYSLFAHLLAIFVVLGVALAVHLTTRPYKDQQDVSWIFSLNLLESGSLGVSFVCAGTTLYVNNSGWTEAVASQYVTVFLLVAFGALLSCLLVYEGSAKVKNVVLGQTKAHDSSARGQEAEGSGANGERLATDAAAPSAS